MAVLIIGQAERWTPVIVAILNAFVCRALRARDFFAFLDIVGGRSNRLVDKCSVVVQIDRAAEFNRADCDASGINVEQEPQSFLAVA